jgi:hypothetical protein
MLKQWFQGSRNGDTATADGPDQNGSAYRAPAAAQPAGGDKPSWEPPGSSNSEAGPAVTKFAGFEEIYRNAPVKPPKVAYDILKIAEMVNSPHLSELSVEAKRCSLMMALEAIDVRVEDLLQDAMVRQRALNDYEDALQTKLKEFEAAKAKENSMIQAELDRLSAAHLRRIQANREAVAREEDHLRDWRKLKQEESEHIAEAAAFCAPQGASASAGSGLAATLARCGVTAAGESRR